MSHGCSAGCNDPGCFGGCESGSRNAVGRMGHSGNIRIYKPDEQESLDEEEREVVPNVS